MKLTPFSSLIGLALAATVHAASPVTYEDGRLNNGIVSVSFEEDGTFSLDGLPSGAPLRLELALQRRVVSCLAECASIPPGDTHRVDWTIGSGVNLDCVVRDERGEPVEGALVRLLYPSCGGWEPPGALQSHRTDTVGQVTFDDVQPGRWRIELERADSWHRRRTDVDWPEARWSVDVEASLDAPVELTAFDQVDAATGESIWRSTRALTLGLGRRQATPRAQSRVGKIRGARQLTLIRRS